MSTTARLSIRVPKDVLERADRALGKPGEGRSALVVRVLERAVRTAEDAAIDAEYERAYPARPSTAADLARTNALARAAIRSTVAATRPDSGAI